MVILKLKNVFHQHKRPILITNIGIDKMVVPNKVPFGKKFLKIWIENYIEIWEKVKNSIKNEFDSEPVYNEKCLKAKLKSYNGKINTNFYNNKIPKEDLYSFLLYQ